jgi:hypothetical protein
MIRRGQEPRRADSVDPWALQYMSCMLLCRVATVSGDLPGKPLTRLPPSEVVRLTNAHTRRCQWSIECGQSSSCSRVRINWHLIFCGVLASLKSVKQAMSAGPTTGRL